MVMIIKINSYTNDDNNNKILLENNNNLNGNKLCIVLLSKCQGIVYNIVKYKKYEKYFKGMF